MNDVTIMSDRELLQHIARGWPKSSTTRKRLLALVERLEELEERVQAIPMKGTVS